MSPTRRSAGGERPAPQRRGRKVTLPAEVGASPDELTLAAQQVLATWEFSGHAALAQDDLDATVLVLVEAIRAGRAGDQPDLTRIPAFVPARRVLARLRSALLTLPAIDHSVRVDLLRALERVQDALDEDAAHRFMSRLDELDAQKLVVEMAHDMRSPLGSILILAERLRSEARAAEMHPLQQRQLGLIYSAAFGLSALAGDVIELARGGTTLLDVQPIPFAVSDVLQSIQDILRPMAEEKRLVMTCRGPQADLRSGHPAALNRVLLNLTTNALKFTNAGSVDVTVRELDRVRVEFVVSDTGRGIPEHVQSHLFDAFRQRQNPGDYAFSSAGLGLSICQKLVRAMGGELQVDTELERGTRFSFTLALPQPDRF